MSQAKNERLMRTSQLNVSFSSKSLEGAAAEFLQLAKNVEFSTAIRDTLSVFSRLAQSTL
jgi:hypothetical protein